MFDKLLNIGCAFDWITPLFAFIQDLLAGPVADFGIPANPYWGMREVKQFLQDNGIEVWGIMYNFDGDVLMFTVRQEQIEETLYLLRSEGIPILYAP